MGKEGCITCSADVFKQLGYWHDRGVKINFVVNNINPDPKGEPDFVRYMTISGQGKTKKITPCINWENTNSNHVGDGLMFTARSQAQINIYLKYQLLINKISSLIAVRS